MKVGYIGLGKMGAPMAHNLLKAGYSVTVNDMSKAQAKAHVDAGAAWAETPAQLAASADIILFSLPGPREVEAVMLGPDGILAAAKTGSTIIDLSTNSPSVVRMLHERCAKRGIRMLDAPVSGGPKGSRDGTLTIWVGGDEGVFEDCRQVLGAIATDLLYVGPIGSATVAKLAHNCVGFVVNGAVAEIFALGTKAGIEPLALWKALRKGALGKTRLFDNLPKHFLLGKYEPGFALQLAYKDASLAVALGRELKVPMKLANITVEEMTEALNRGWGDQDARVAMRLELERAGVSIAVDPQALEAALKEG